MRKVIALVLLVVLLVSSVPVQVHAAYENTYTNTGDQRADIIGVALTQVGYQEGPGNGVWNNDTKYGTWAGHPGTEWCGWFVSWCARQAGIPTSVLRTNGRASPSGFGISQYYTSSQYTPRPGDLFFKKNFGHVGIVYYVDGNYFYTLEGNTSTSGWDGTSVMSRRRALSEFYFASPAYTSDSGTPSVHNHNYQQGYENAHPHKEYYKCSSCGSSYYTGATKTVSGCNSCSSSSGQTPSQPVHTHSYGSWFNNGSSTHARKCSCGKWETQSHSWQDDEILEEPTCQEDGKMQQKCSVCSRTRTVTMDKLEEHVYLDWIVGDDATHKRMCEYCYEEQVEPHQLMADQQGNPVWQRSEDSHWYQCADCGNKSQSAEHVLQTGNDQQSHWQYCQGCDQIITPPTPHVYTQVASKDEENHWYACTGCEARTEPEPHRYQLIPWEEGVQVESCEVCQQLSGQVVVKEESEKLVEAVTAGCTVIGKLIIRQQVEPKWYVIAGGSACAAALVIFVTTVCLIVHGARKRKKRKQPV